MFKKSIERRVSDFFRTKIQAAQDAHDEHCKMLEEKLEKDKQENEELVVNALLGKFL